MCGNFGERGKMKNACKIAGEIPKVIILDGRITFSIKFYDVCLFLLECLFFSIGFLYA
jgi:hypothetical protein